MESPESNDSKGKNQKPDPNICIIGGRLCKPPDVREKVAFITIINSHGGQKSFVNFVAFGKAINHAKRLSKGQYVFIQGSYKLNKYKDRTYPQFVAYGIYTTLGQINPEKEVVDSGFQNPEDLNTEGDIDNSDEADDLPF